jgi:bifunctional ADP-heptose synthase (sugar kinase/adenylyltransferase)
MTPCRVTSRRLILAAAASDFPPVGRGQRGAVSCLEPSATASMVDELAVLRCVDYVVVFDEASIADLVAAVAPDVPVKSAQYGPEGSRVER